MMVRKLTIILLATVLMAGTVGAAIAYSMGSLATSNANPPAPEPPLPETPTPLNASNVGPFAVAYEEAYVYESLTGNGERSIETFEFACEPSVAEIQSADGFLVMLECTYSYEDEMAEEPYIAGESRAYTLSYRIDANKVIRNDPDPVGDTGGASGGQTVAVVDYIEYPERPANLNEDTVVAYAIAHEKATKHNNVLASLSADTVTEIQVSCTNTSVEESNGEFTVELDCGHSHTVKNDGRIAVADGIPYSATYIIGKNNTDRIVHQTAHDNYSDD